MFRLKHFFQVGAKFTENRVKQWGAVVYDRPSNGFEYLRWDVDRSGGKDILFLQRVFLSARAALKIKLEFYQLSYGLSWWCVHVSNSER